MKFNRNKITYVWNNQIQHNLLTYQIFLIYDKNDFIIKFNTCHDWNLYLDSYNNHIYICLVHHNTQQYYTIVSPFFRYIYSFYYYCIGHNDSIINKGHAISLFIIRYKFYINDIDKTSSHIYKFSLLNRKCNCYCHLTLFLNKFIFHCSHFY